jgi:hypothetical protein
MKLYDLVRKFRGKEELMMTDSYVNVNARQRQLKNSQRNGVSGRGGKRGRVEYEIKESEASVKYMRKVHHG